MSDSDLAKGSRWSVGPATVAAAAATAATEAVASVPAGRPTAPGKLRAKLICGKDLVWVAILLVLVAPAWLLPLAVTERVTSSLIGMAYRIRRRRYADYERMFRATLPGAYSDEEIDALVARAISFYHLERIYLLRFYRPLAWYPRVRVEGLEHLGRALADGHGAILWVKPSSFSDIMTKVALSRMGYAVSHLSRHTHGGFSETRFGIRFLNAIRTRIECRYLKQRVVIDPRRPRAALKRLADLLELNQVVSVTVGGEAKRVTYVPVGGELLPLAGGPAKLSAESGAPLLPVFTERLSDGSFLVTVEAPIEVPGMSSKDKQVGLMLHRYGVMLSAHAQRLPEQHHCLTLYRRAAMLKQQSL